MPNDAIACVICGKKYHNLLVHIRSHGYSWSKFKKEYPNTPSISESLRESRRKKIKAAHNRPEIKAKVSAIQKIVQNRVEVKTRKSMSSRRLWKDPKYRSKQSAAHKGFNHSTKTRAEMAVIAKIIHNKPEVKAKHSAAMSKRWEDPEYTKSMSGKNNPINLPGVRARHKAAQRRPEVRAKKSIASSGENNPNFKGWISRHPYCHLFNDVLKERIRNKYGRVCVNCGKNEILNGRRLSVHHVDGNKMQGCDGHKWFLIPLCKSCNSKHLEDSPFHIVLFWLKNVEERVPLNTYNPIISLDNSEHIELSQIVSI